ncbi:hypothetical protein CesoFtcFv8_013299 [Champsocephalus esox]|uniref:Uncharacterized protein n=1 Tax=Champsocephalus esox TaxID=159716 RepID=A0AAN8GVX8_9TELE|nr:hypothetical protein CesoFtcFv8_013299 [Champsocephalus esox]
MDQILQRLKKNTKGRLKFDNEHLDDAENAWEKVVWSEETNIEIFGISSTRRVWRKRNADYNPEHHLPVRMEVETFCCGVFLC